MADKKYRVVKMEKYVPTPTDYEDESILKIRLKAHETHQCSIPVCEFCYEDEHPILD